MRGVHHILNISESGDIFRPAWHSNNQSNKSEHAGSLTSDHWVPGVVAKGFAKSLEVQRSCPSDERGEAARRERGDDR